MKWVQLFRLRSLTCTIFTYPSHKLPFLVTCIISCSMIFGVLPSYKGLLHTKVATVLSGFAGLTGSLIKRSLLKLLIWKNRELKPQIFLFFIISFFTILNWSYSELINLIMRVLPLQFYGKSTCFKTCPFFSF